MSAHSNIGPSGAKRWMNCPGSVTLEVAAPRMPAGEYAVEGTVAHDVAERFASGKINTEQLMALVGTTVKQEGYEIEITDEMVDAAIDYADHIKADVEALRATKGSAETVVQFEQRVCASSVDPDLWGTADCIVYKKGKKLIVRDLKYGKGVAVEVEDNEQMSIYAIAVMDTIKCWAFDEVELVVDQPRAAHADGTERRWTTSVEALKEFRDKLIDAVAQTRDPLAPTLAGDWCRWCKARPVCSTVHAAVQKEAQADFTIEPPVSNGTNAAARMMERLPQVRFLSNEQLVRAFAWEDNINSFFEAVKEVIREKLSNGETIPGVKLVEGRSNRAYTDERQVIAEFAPLFGEDGLYEKKLLSPAKLEKKVGKGKLDHLTFKPEGKKSVALDRDPRPAAKSSAQEDFAALPAPEPFDPLGLSVPAKVIGEPGDQVVVTDLEAELLGLGTGAKAAAPKKREPMWPQ